MLTVHLRITDAATGQPTPARVAIAAADGTQFAPLGRSPEFPTGRNEAVGGQVRIGRDRWFYIDGACEIPLPAGVPLRVQVSKGPEFTALDERVTLGTGQLTLRLSLIRWANLRAEGWMSVDTRCHFLSPPAALLEAAAEGLDVVNILAVPFPLLALDANTYTTVPDLLAFSGQAPALEREGVAVVVNTQNSHPVLGTLGLLHSHRPVFPLTFGGFDDTDDWGICDWCDQCHRKGGLTVWIDAFEPAGGVTGGEALVAAILGKIDAIEVTAAPRKLPLLPSVYRLWNAGVLVPLVGGSGKDSNRLAMGTLRTYAKVVAGGGREPTVPEQPGGTGRSSMAGWLTAIRAGHTFVTAGPLVELHRDGNQLRATARTQAPVEQLELVANGEVIATGSTEVVAPLPAAGWVAARCHSAAGNFAHTSPLAVGPRLRTPEAVAALLRLIDQTREWAEQHGCYANPKRREQLLGRCAEAAAKLGTST